MMRLTTLIAILALTVPAAAQVAGPFAPPPPTLKRAVTVTDDIVRIGDLVDHAGALESVPIFRAPELGGSGAVSIARIRQALAAHDLANLESAGLSEVVVTRASRTIARKAFETGIAGAFAIQGGGRDPGKLAVRFDHHVGTIHVESDAMGDVQIVRAQFDQRSGRFDIAFALPGTQRRPPLRFTGTVVEMTEAAVPTRTLARGDVLRAADIAIELRPKAEVTGEVLVTAEQVLGQAARLPLRAGQTVRAADLMKPELVHRNETVIITYSVPGIVLTMRGKALEGGTRNEIVNVLNIQSKRTIQATVTGQGHVTVTGTTPRHVANATLPAAAVNGARTARAE